MPPSDSMFLFEIVVEELKSYIDCKEFYIRSQFADVFKLNLRDPNELANILPKHKKKLNKNKATIRNVQSPVKKDPLEGKVQSGQSILFASSIDILISSMKRFPIELTLWDKDDSVNMLGLTHIPWSPVYIEYLHKITIKQDPMPAFVSGGYNVFDEYTSKRMATIRLNIKLTYLKDKITTTFRSVSEHNQKTFVYTGFNSKATSILSTVKDNSFNLKEDTGIIKSIYSGGKRSFQSKATKKPNKTCISGINEYEPPEEPNASEQDKKCKFDQSILSVVKSDTDLDINKQIEVIKLKTKSCTSVNKEQHNILNYIFGDGKERLGNLVYCVGYFSVENDFAKSLATSQSSKKTISEKNENSSRERCKFHIYDSQCSSRKADDGTYSQIVSSLDLPDEAADLITVTKCKQIDCDNKKGREVPEPPDERMFLDLKSLNKECCDIAQTVEQVTGGMTDQIKSIEHDCFCSCECTFGFVKKTTYCEICGGYETAADDFRKLPNVPFPCPIFHKLVDKNKRKSLSSGSESKKRGDDSQRNLKTGTKSTGSAKPDKNAESDKDSKKGIHEKKNDRFKFNYGYIAPKVGHVQCAAPCTGTLGAVPKNMGWLWSAEDVPGIKFRPMWKPGATNKHVVCLLRSAKNPGQVITKKKRKDSVSKKKSLKRPLLMVQKKEGEYTVTMETMKTYAKPRIVNQFPYEDKPLLTFTIGRTDEENRQRHKKKEREHRRLEREQRKFVQRAFRDMCNEICLKTYQQALGLLPDAEDPDCLCYPAHPGADKANLDVSCSCSEDRSSISSDTDSDEWVVEFTPPSATFNPTFKGIKVLKADNTSQYTYLDYRVKLSDRYGNPIPRYFKGPNGKNICSDLGGFWSPEHKWLEINTDGYIAPDGRWAPMSFIGPGGEQIECDTGKFQTANLKWLVVGIDGFVDYHGKWKFYPKTRSTAPQKKPGTGGGTGKKGAGDKKDDGATYRQSHSPWSCFGDVSPKQLSQIGIVGHGNDRQILLATLKKMLAHGEDVKIPQPSTVPRMPPSKKGKRPLALSPKAIDKLFMERVKCHHPVPSDKGIVSADEHGHKNYFKMNDHKSKSPKQRVTKLAKQGKIVSSFHVPCFNSFLNAEMMKQQQYERVMGTKSKCVSTQMG